MGPVLYATISPFSRERMYGNVEDQKRQGEWNVVTFYYKLPVCIIVPSDEDIALISQRVAHKWRLVGQELGFDPAELDQIASECVFRKWSAREITASYPFTWKGVIETLDSDLVRESSLARDLESTHL